MSGGGAFDASRAPPRHDASRIGLLGGSFNPAHDGHRDVSVCALDALRLDAVWWLVSPGNPLKDPGEYAPYEERLATARRVANHRRIVASDFERRKGLQYTVDTLRMVTDLWPQARFVWLMGADSLRDFHRWRDWREIASLAPIAVFNRPGHEEAPVGAEAAIELAAFKVDSAEASSILEKEPPAWAFIGRTANPTSSTDIRRRMDRRD
ncbi:MAG: nicotinate-nucleotide adenylyltransferase [Parvularculaceae bacterium]